jgi:hypothetical protein
MKRRERGMVAVVTVGLALGLSGCVTTHQTRGTETSGFLKHSDQLNKGADGDALLVYNNPAADFGKYTSIQIDKIQVYAGPESKLAKVPKEDVKRLVNYLDAALRKQLKGDYRVVTTAGPKTMRLRVAVTDAKASRVTLDTLSAIMPPGMAISALTKMATGTASAVGSTSIEAELVDSVTGERLFAAVDERAGRKYTGKFDKFDKWQDVRDAYDYWAERTKTRLTELKAKQ